MDPNENETALRMIPYGPYVSTGETGGNVTAATVARVTLVSFEPPRVVLGVEKDAISHAVVERSACFALDVLGEGQQDLAFYGG